MGQLFCKHKENKVRDEYNTPRVANDDNIVIHSTELSQTRQRRLSICENCFEDYVCETPVFQPYIRHKNIVNHKPFVELDGVK